VLGGADRGAEVAGWLGSRGTVGVCATQLGVLERALELTAGYARSREQFGRPIGSFQAVAQRLADAYVDVEAVRLTLWQAAWLLAEGSPDGPTVSAAVSAAVATAKFWAADAGHRVAHTAVHVHGGLGIDTSYPVHRYFVAAKRAEFTLGGATAQLLRLGDVLAGEVPAPLRPGTFRRFVCPEPDQGAEAVNHRCDDSIVRQRQPDFFGCGTAFCRGPGEQLAERGGEAGLDFTPAPRGP